MGLKLRVKLLGKNYKPTTWYEMKKAIERLRRHNNGSNGLKRST